MEKQNFIITFINTDIENEIANAFILAKSIRKQNVISNIIAFVTSKKQKSIELLKYFYDDVIILESLTYDIFKHPHLNSSEKTLFINCNSIVLKNISNIFNLTNNTILYDNDDNKLLHYKYKYKKSNEIQNFNDKNNINYSINYAIDLKESYSTYDIVFFNLIQPSILENNISIEERSNYPILIFWFYLYRGILNVNPQLYDNKILKQTNEILTYYFIQLSNLTPQINKSFQKGNCKAINEIFNDKIDNNYGKVSNNKIDNNYDKVSNDKIDNNYGKGSNDNIDTINNNCQFYHLDYSKEYESFEINYSVPVENTTVIVTINEGSTKSIISKELTRNIILSKIFNLNQLEIKNLLFKINTQYTYSERTDTLNKLYGVNDGNKTFSVKLIIYKTLIDDNIEHMDNQIMFFTSSYDKIKVLSLLLNHKSYSLLNHINFINLHKMDNFKNILIYQSVKKWIYSIFNGNEIENMIIVKLDFRSSDKIIIINNNDASVVNIKKISNKKIELLDIIFAKSALYNDISKQYEKCINAIGDNSKHFLFDGLKVYDIVY